MPCIGQLNWVYPKDIVPKFPNFTANVLIV